MQFGAGDVAGLGRGEEGDGVGDLACLAEAQTAALLAQIPIGRLGQASEIAHAVAFLASPEAGYITGTELHVNGGMFMQ